MRYHLFRDLADKSREIAQGLAQDILGPIKEALTSGEFSWRSFADAISRIAQNLAKRLIELAFKPIENALLSAFSGGGGGGGFFASLFGFAKGGVFAGGQELTAFSILKPMQSNNHYVACRLMSKLREFILWASIFTSNSWSGQTPAGGVNLSLSSSMGIFQRVSHRATKPCT